LRQLFVPRQWEERVREAVKNHQEMERLIEELSDLEWKRLKERRSKAVLRRLIHYSEKIFDLSEKVLQGVSDRRPLPRISTHLMLQSVLGLYWARLGSLHALEMVRRAPLWKHWLGQPMASADTVGRVYALLENAGLRRGLQHVYRRLKRNKVLRSVGGWDVAVLDGHENHASYRRHCAGCLQRTSTPGPGTASVLPSPSYLDAAG